MQKLLISSLLRVEDHVRATWARGCEEIQVGPFSAFFHPTDGAMAVAAPREPVADAKQVPALVAALRREFHARAAKLRIEFSLVPHANLPAELQLQGLVREEETPLMLATPESFTPAPGDPDTQIRFAGERDDLAFVAAMVRQGFELRGALGEADVAALRASVAAGVRVAVAKVGGAPAGTGFSAPASGVTEISTVSTLPTMRRRGVAARLVSFLVGEHMAGGGGDLAWACAPDAAAYALLSRLGFLDAAVRASYREP